MQILKGRVAYITYSVVDQAGMVVAQHDQPIAYVQGGDSGLFGKIEQALEGKQGGDRVEVELSPEEGFGEHDPDLTFTDDLANVPPEYRQLGAEVLFENDKGETMMFYVTRIEGDQLTIDANPPLAGQTVTCVVNVLDVREATPEELSTGVAADSPPPMLH